MRDLHIIVNNKIATYLSRDGSIVCRNKDYQIIFSFDSEWDAYGMKVARFIWNDGYRDIPFSGNIVAVPEISNAEQLEVGVYAGDLSTTTPAVIPCMGSVLCKHGLEEIPEPTPELYQQILEECGALATRAVNAVLYAPQSLTDVQRAQARENIGAASVEAENRLTDEIAAERARINQFVALKDGSTTGDAELQDIRVGYNGTVYETAGEAVRKQVGAISDILKPATKLTLMQECDSADDTGHYYTRIDPLSAGNKYLLEITSSKTGTFTLQAGSGCASSLMVDTIATKDFVAGQPVTIDEYAPSGDWTAFKLSSGTSWNIKIYTATTVAPNRIDAIEEKVDAIEAEVDAIEEDVGAIKEALNFKVIASYAPPEMYAPIFDLENGSIYQIIVQVATDVKSATIGLYKDTASGHVIENFVSAQALSAGTYVYTFTKTAEAKYIRNYLDGNVADSIVIKQEKNMLDDMSADIAETEGRVTNLETKVKNLAGRSIMANKYMEENNSRESHLRQLHYYTGEADVFYGSKWAENEAGVTAINTDGYNALHTELPIQNKMRRCVIKDGIIQYYLDANNSALKADGSAAVLDGTDGDVCVEIPEFFFKFEESVNASGNREISLKISEQGINGYNYSPKMYVGAYEATINRETGYLASVCTTAFSVTSAEVKTNSADNYIVNASGYSHGVQKVVKKTGHTANAAMYRGSNNDPAYDGILDENNDNYWLNHLGVPVAYLSREEYRNAEDVEHGKLMYLYDAHRALWILSMVEFKMKNIQKPISSGGLGWGATMFPAYDAFKVWTMDSSESIVPCGTTNVLGNNSGEVYIKLTNVPVSITGSYPNADPSTIVRGDVWMPCMSYRGVEHYYGHLYKTLDQVTLYTKDTGEVRERDGREIFDVSYYYQRNPFVTDDLMQKSELVGPFTFCPVISPTMSYVFGMDGHILPKETVSESDMNHTNERTYCDCTEFGTGLGNGVYQLDTNGSLINNNLPGRNMLVGVFTANGRYKRASNGTRLTVVCCK